MSVDIVKQLEKAKRFVEKGRAEEAIEAYQSVLSAVPNHMNPYSRWATSSRCRSGLTGRPCITECSLTG